MKFCTKCGTVLRDEAVICPQCGCECERVLVKPETSQPQGVKYCSYCGAEVLKEAVVCPKCGCQLKSSGSISSNTGTGLQTAAKIFMIISCVLSIYLLFIPLIWVLPMTLHYNKAIKNKQPVGTGFKVCTILFVNPIAGILMLCDTNNNK